MLSKKIEMEKKLLPHTSPDSRRPRRQTNKQQSELNLACRRQRTMPRNLQQKDDQIQQSVSNTAEAMNLSSYDVEDSVQSNETMSTCNSKLTEIIGLTAAHSPNTKSSETIFSVFVDKEPALASSEEESAESGFVHPEYPSPVSVLDIGMHKQEYSPVKYAGRSLKVDDEENPNLANLKTVNSESTGSVSDFNEKKLQNIESLVQKLIRLNSSCDEPRTDYIASLCESSKPDHRYISEILLASGLLLRALTDFHFHPSGHPINPELFLVLEQTKGSTSLQGHKRVSESLLTGEKNHRKLIFDTVNEILSKKFSSINIEHSEPWSRSVGPVAKSMTPQMLLRGLCSDIESLVKIPKCSSDNGDEEWKSIITSDMTKHNNPSEMWMDFNSEISGAVLDIERMIFKDLVCEIVVTGEPNPLSMKSHQRRHDV